MRIFRALTGSCRTGRPRFPRRGRIFPNNIPTGSKYTLIISLNGRNPIGDRGPIAILDPPLHEPISGKARGEEELGPEAERTRTTGELRVTQMGEVQD
jgi:hypothetical protein